MAVTINVNGLSLCHKQSGGVANATAPDVCLTPAPGGPVPVPYPNTAFSKDLSGGTTSVFVDGGNMAAIQGSQFSTSIGDEAGTSGGVGSGTFNKEATWMTFSFDVKLEGKGACRLTDKMFMNHGNTVCCGGFIQEFLKSNPTKSILDACEALRKLLDDLIADADKKDGIKGLARRFKEQNAGRGGPFDAPVPGKQQNVWKGHDMKIEQQQKYLDRKIDEYDEDCGDKGPPIPIGVREWVKKPRPSPEQWVGPNTGPNVGTVAVAVGFSVLAIGLLLFPFDGPLGEAATGAAAFSAWGQVLAH